MTPELFEDFKKLVYEQSGIFLREGKEAMVCARLSKRMRLLGISEHQEYFKLVMEDESGGEIMHLLDAISTNVTGFFREPYHFDFLSEKMAEWYEDGQERFRFWSAGCSSGEEPYSLAMTILETLNGNEADVKILATDISTRALERARQGIYEAKKVGAVDEELLERYFYIEPNIRGECYCVGQELRDLIVFSRLNLAKPPFPMHGPFDVIFCRNVMIYFDNAIRITLLAEMHRLLKPGGYLILGHAESLAGLFSDFKVLKPSIYIKKGN